MCFVLLKQSMLHVTVPIKQLKSALVDFYSVESLSEAKVQLLYDIQIKSNKIKYIWQHKKAK